MRARVALCRFLKAVLWSTFIKFAEVYYEVQPSAFYPRGGRVLRVLSGFASRSWRILSLGRAWRELSGFRKTSTLAAKDFSRADESVRISRRGQKRSQNIRGYFRAWSGERRRSRA